MAQCGTLMQEAMFNIAHPAEPDRRFARRREEIELLSAGGFEHFLSVKPILALVYWIKILSTCARRS
jgi:hypothetical protein